LAPGQVEVAAQILVSDGCAPTAGGDADDEQRNGKESRTHERNTRLGAEGAHGDALAA